MKNEVSTEGMSLSKQRKIEKQAEIARKKREERLSKIVWTLVAVLVVALIALWITTSVVRKARAITPDTNYSAQIDDDGKIKKVNVADIITMPDYNNIDADLADLEYSDEEMEENISNLLKNNRTLEESGDLEAKMDDSVVIDYVGTVDGEEFDGGSDTDYELLLGSGSFIDDFEEQIVGHKPGDEFDVEVTFPDEYKNNPDLSGLDAVFAVTLKGIYVVPEFTDEFVQDKLSSFASTAEEYRQYLKDINYKNNLKEFVEDYLTENTKVNSVPKAYEKQLKQNFKANDYSYFEYMNQLYNSYYGYSVYSTFADYVKESYDQTEEEYDASLGEKVHDGLAYTLCCQAIAEKEGITATIDEVKEHYLEEGNSEDAFNTELEACGTGYMIQQRICEKVVDYVSGLVNVK